MALTVVILGDGAMATVCARIAAEKLKGVGEVRVWGRTRERMEEMERSRENVRYLPGVKLGENVRFCGDDAALFDVGAGSAVGMIVCAVPTQYMRGALERLKGVVPAGVPVVSVAKGIEIGT